MKITHFIIAAILLVSTSVLANNHKKVPTREANKWHKNLNKSDYKIYENFDNCIVEYDSIKQHITDKTHLKFIMGCSSDKGKSIDFRMFMIYIIGDEIEQGYVNDYKTIRYFNGKSWTSCDKEMLEQWSRNWENYQATNNLPYIRAFLVPNDDLNTLNKGEIYLSFGLEKSIFKKTVKLLLSDTKFEPASNKNKLAIADPIYMDACMPCPKVCGSDGM